MSQWNKIHSILFLQLFFIITSLSFAAQTDSLQLRIFPELIGKKIFNVSIIDSNAAVAAGKKALYIWNGNKWKIFDKPFPLKNFEIHYLKAFSLKNIWIFVRKHQKIYHSHIYHFNGYEWQSIPSPQPYNLLYAYFIDSTRFYASGEWGSFIYYDGKTVKNLQSPGGTSIRIVKVFNPFRFYAWVQKQEFYPVKFYLYEFHNSKWTVLLKIKEIPKTTYFLTPDSGFIVTAKKHLFQYTKDKKLVLLDTLPVSTILSYHFSDDLKIYYWNNKKLYAYDIKKSRFFPITKLNFPARIFPLGKKDFFLIDGYRKLLYFGYKDIGEIFKKTPSHFLEYDFGKKGNHLSVSCYRDQNNNITLYYTNPFATNNFYYFHFKTNTIQIKDNLIDCGLIGYKKESDYPYDKFDSSVCFADIDNDGNVDAIISALKGESLVYENIGKDKFKDITQEVNFRLQGRFNAICWGDLNLDGLLDFVVGDETGPPKIFINQGFFRFKNIKKLTGIPDSLDYYYIPSMADMDNDGDLDLFFFSLFDHIYYFQNQGINPQTKLPRFDDKSKLSPQLTTRSDFFTQSIEFGDYDNDGDLDLFLANRISPIKLFENQGKGIFIDVSAEKGFNQSVMAYGANWGDLNQDGYLDLFLATLGKNYIFWNKAGKYFAIDSTSLPNNDLSYSTGSILEDLDSDGDLDIAIANFEISYSRIYRNLLNQNNYLKIELRGKKSNYYGIGGKIWLYEAGHIGNNQYLKGYRQIFTNTGLNSSHLPIAHFGVSMDSRYDAIIEFPGGEKIQKFNLNPGHIYTIHEQVSLIWRAAKILEGLKIFIFRPGYRQIALRFLFFLFILLIFNLYTLFKTYWPIFHLFFFNLSLFSIYFIISILFYTTEINLRWALPIYVTGLAGIILYIIVQHYTTIKFKRENQLEFYDLFRQFHHSKDGMKQINHIIFFLNNIHQVAQNKKICQYFLNELKNLKNITFPFIQKIINEGKRMGLPHLHLRRLKICLKQLDNEISQIILSFPASIQNLTAFETCVKRLKDDVLTIQKTIERNFESNVIKVLNNALSEFHQFTEISIMYPNVQKNIKVIIPPNDLTQVFTNLFQNSLDAMENSTTRRLQIEIEPLIGNQLIIKIKDSGKGIPSHLKEQIFEETFSTKGSTGLGLFHARKLLRRFGGDLELLKSKPGKGSIFQIKLRVTET